MGGAVSSGQNNDELIDNLKDAEYIKTTEVERIFRIVDRAHYYLAECRESAYKDLAWKNGTLHLSAPCIYSEVMEALELKKGMSFLNLGSGTGYLNTMVGFMIGPYGINHGIELYADNVNYAREKLENFILTCPKFDDIELGEPQFVVGNCLNLAPENRLYDRVYCGASCPIEQMEIIQNMIKVNGILVIPVGDQLLKIRRKSQKEFSSESVLPVSFASLVLPVPAHNNADPIVLPEVNPLSLQCICRVIIRSAIRDTFDFKTASASRSSHIRKPRQAKSTKFFRHEGGHYPLNILPTTQGLMIMGTFDHSDEDDDDIDDDHNADEGDADASEPSDDSIFDLDQQLCHHASVLRRARERSLRKEEKQKTDDVDSDLSNVEEDEIAVSQASHLKDVNGNKHLSLEESSSKQKVVADHMDSDYGTSGEGDEKDCRVNGKALLRKHPAGIKEGSGSRTKGGRMSRSSRSAGQTSASEFSYSNSYERFADRILSIMTPRKMENTERSSSPKVKTVIVPNMSSLQENALGDNELTPELNNVSPAIQVTPSGSSLSEPRAIRESYSTSADTETSGFGSLGDDTLQVGSHQSGLGYLKDDLELMSGDDYAAASTIPTEDSHELPWFHSTRRDSSVDTDTKVHDDDNADVGWMDIEEDDGSSEEDFSENEKEMKKGKTCAESIKSKIDHENCSISHNDDEEDNSKTSPRGSEFTVFLKAKVETLPIPSTIKAFIVYYR